MATEDPHCPHCNKCKHCGAPKLAPTYPWPYAYPYWYQQPYWNIPTPFFVTNQSGYIPGVSSVTLTST